MSELLRVFLCHSSQDKQFVRDLCNKLLFDSFDVWLDENKLLPGQEWEMEIPKAVRNSHIVIVCLSQKSTHKEGYVQKEIKVALDIADEKPEGTIFLIPARLDDCVVPDRLRKWHWVDLFTNNGYQKLQNSLNLRMASLGLNKLPPPVSTSEILLETNLSSSEIAHKELEPPEAENVTTHSRLADYREKIKEGILLDDIIIQLKSDLSLQPKQVALWQTLGDAYMRSNKLKDALESYNIAEELLR